MLNVVRLKFGMAFGIILVLAGFDLASSQIEISDCATCHKSIAAEWSRSLHSEAYSTLQFLAQREETVDPSCGCHAPDFLAPDNLGKSPPARKVGRASGVDCKSCHLDAEMVVWSSGAKRFVPHWTQQAEIYSNGQFCAGCHGWARHSSYDCSSCHMPGVDGPAADGPHLEAVAQSTHRSHRWAGSSDPDLVSSALTLEVDTSGEDLAVEITNMVYAHKVPATDHRKVVLVLVDGSNDQVVWEEQVAVPASSTVNHRINKPEVPRGFSIQLRYYPAPEVGSDEFFVIGTHELAK